MPQIMNEILDALKQIIYLKGELNKDRSNIIIKRNNLAKLFIQSGLVRGQDLNTFDIKMSQHFGKRVIHTLEDLEDIVLLIA